MSSPTVRDAFYDLLRERGMTTLFSNPGSTEIPLLTDLPEDLRFVLGLHESSLTGFYHLARALCVKEANTARPEYEIALVGSNAPVAGL